MAQELSLLPDEVAGRGKADMITLNDGWYRVSSYGSILCSSAYYQWRGDKRQLGIRMHKSGLGHMTYLLGGDVGIRVL